MFTHRLVLCKLPKAISWSRHPRSPGFLYSKGYEQLAWCRLYDQDTVHINVEYAYHMQIRLSICTPYMLANTNTLIQSESMLQSSISTPSWNLWT